MNSQASSAFLDAPAPPAEATPPLAALWHAHRGEWDEAHAIVRDAPGPEAAWVHAHLHRVEGDTGNAAYWYRRAGRRVASCDLAAERIAMVAALLGPAAG